MSVTELLEELEKRYPNDIFVLNNQEDKNAYVAKIEFIQEIKKIIGVKDDR